MCHNQNVPFPSSKTRASNSKKKKITFTDFFLIVNFVLLLITIMPLGDRSKLTDE